jgi:CRISPR-associated protein Cmr6
MPSISEIANKVPMMFRAQIEGRCQLQRIPRDKSIDPDVVRWASEWVERAEVTVPEFGEGVEYQDCRLTWRFVTNGGQDDGVIRPVIGARGIPFYPGSSMKGAFRQACDRVLQEKARSPEKDSVDISAEQIRRYCGDKNDLLPGILRFHGGYPTSADWTKNLVDIVHPQQEWQVKTHNTTSKTGGAFVQISLYQPELRFGISSSEPLEPTEWETIWQIWERALSAGLGCRVCAGYGQPKTHTKNVVYRATLRGQGAASQLLNRTSEFRPNIFRSSLRGHALRIFGGLTDANQAEALVEILFGGISGNGAKVGLLAMAFRELKPAIVTDETYDVTGELYWLLTQEIAADELVILKKLVRQLMQFAMLLGGFGRSWRRASHEIFKSDYNKHLIGCHWSWAGNRSPLAENSARKLDDVTAVIDRVRATATEWLTYRGKTTASPIAPPTDWRESWHLQTVQVWGRVADTADESEAIAWLHGAPYSDDYDTRGRAMPLRIKRTSITGGNIDNRLNIGRLWHRMYPIVLRKPDPKQPDRFLPKETPRYLELLTLFPDDSPEFDRFIHYLNEQQDEFKLLWGEP